MDVDTVTSYIAKCAEDVTSIKTFYGTTEKLWMTAEICMLRKAKKRRR